MTTIDDEGPRKRPKLALVDDGFAPAPDPLDLAWYDLNDLGNAGRLASRAHNRLLWDGEKWLGYTGTHWSADDGQRLAVAFTHQVARGLRGEVEALRAHAEKLRAKGEDGKADGLKGRLKKLGDWADESGNAGRASSMLRQAQGLEELNARPTDFDQDPLLLTVQNGALELTRVEGGAYDVTLRRHDPQDRVTRVAAVAYDPKADCPGWKAHLELCLPDPEVRDFLQTCLGYALTGYTREQVIFVLQGKGGDGKSTTMNVVRRLLGGFAIAADVRTFLDTGARDAASASPDRVRLASDTRLVSTGEPGFGQSFDEALLKSFTGGSPLLARELHGRTIEFTPRGKLFVECNARPRIKGGDDGIWRRMVVVPFPVQIPKDRLVRGLEDRLVLEGPGILNWLLEGLFRWLEEGLVYPAAVVEAIDDYRRGSNPFAEWFGERLELDPDAKIGAGMLHQDYKDWCAENGHEPMTATAFGRALGDRQIVLCGKDRGGRKLRRGARIRPLVVDDLPGTEGY